MKSYEEMARSALSRIEAHETEKKNRKKTAARIALPVVSICLLAGIGFGVWQSGLNRQIGDAGMETAYRASEEATMSAPKEPKEQGSSEAPVTESSETIGEPTEPIEEEKSAAEAPAADGQKGLSTKTRGFAYLWWNDRKVCGALVYAMEESPDETFAVLATFRPTADETGDFTYEGKTLTQLADEAFADGAPQEAIKSYKLAYNAYLDAVMPETVEALTAAGVRCEPAPYVTNALTLYVDMEGLKTLPLENMASWTFDLAKTDTKSAPQTDPDGNLIVN